VSVIDEAKGTVAATIHVGSDPTGVAVDPADHTAYVTNLVGDSVSVIDETTGAVTATIKVGAGPSGVAVDTSAHTAYVANGGAGSVSVIDEAKGTVTATIKVGSGPSAVAVDPTAHTAYVTNLSGTVSVIDETTGAVASTVPVGSDPDGVAVDPTAHTAYVTNENASTVSVIGIVEPVLPVTTATSSHDPSSVGQSVTFTAKVGPVNGGTMTFSHGTTALCRAVSLTHVSGSTYHATCTTSTLPAGRDTISAVYPGDASYAASTGTLTQTVNRVTTALTVSVGLTPQYGAFILTAKLAASGRPLRGQPVSFSTGATLMCTQKTSTLGVATCVLTGPEVVLAAKDKGAIRASYPGNTSYLPSSVATVLPGFP
jgi:YVTN family beta-propeller protein